MRSSILKVAIVVIGIGGAGLYTGLHGQYFGKDATTHALFVVISTVAISGLVVGLDLLNRWLATRKRRQDPPAGP
jgi:hypothetical protein